MYKEIASNKRKTVLLMLFFVVFVGFLGWLFSLYLGDVYITPFVLAGALVYALVTYFVGGKMALAFNGAKPIAKRDNPGLYRLVENLAITEGLPTPNIYIIDDPAPNAFATGRDPNHSSVAVTTGLLEIMDKQELQGVLAHELGHVKNYDIRISMIAFALVAVVSIIADTILRMTWFRDSDDEDNSWIFLIGIVAAIIAPIIALVIQSAVSRKREFLADATGALTTRYPEGLASALGKIRDHGSAMRKQNTSTAHLFFANPLKKGNLTNMFSTHPPVDDRIARLRQMGQGA